MVRLTHGDGDGKEHPAADGDGGHAREQTGSLSRWRRSLSPRRPRRPKSWVFRFTLNGRAREMGLGGLTKVSLADARKKATDARRSSVTDTIRSHFARKRKRDDLPPKNYRPHTP